MKDARLPAERRRGCVLVWAVGQDVAGVYCGVFVTLAQQPLSLTSDQCSGGGRAPAGVVARRRATRRRLAETSLRCETLRRPLAANSPPYPFVCDASDATLKPRRAISVAALRAASTSARTSSNTLSNSSIRRRASTGDSVG